MNLNEAKQILKQNGYILNEHGRSPFQGMDRTTWVHLAYFTYRFTSAKSRNRLNNVDTILKFINGFASFIPDAPAPGKVELREKINFLIGKLRELGVEPPVISADGKVNGQVPPKPPKQKCRDAVANPQPIRQAPPPRPAERQKYIVCYHSTTDDDTCKVWTMAYDEEEAIANIRDEYWDVGRICYVQKSNI